jgi:hypothetical protein
MRIAPHGNLPLPAALLAEAQHPLPPKVAVIIEPQLRRRPDARARVSEHAEHGPLSQADDV